MTSVNNLPIILVLGDDCVGVQIVNWLQENFKNEFQIKFATRGDRPQNFFETLEKEVDYLGGVTRQEANSLAAKYAGPTNHLITCYWPWILPPESFENYTGNTVNFHPALLPNDRGWYPHVHQIKLGLDSGVTLHQLDPNADTGNIWIQKKIILDFPTTAGEARSTLQRAMVDIFKKNWERIKDKEINPIPQTGAGNFWDKVDVEKLNTLDLSENLSLENLLRLISSRNSGNRSFFYIETPSGRKFVHIRFSEDGSIG